MKKFFLIQEENERYYRLKKKICILVVVLALISCAEYVEKPVSTELGELLILHSPKDKNDSEDWGELEVEDIKKVSKNFFIKAIGIMEGNKINYLTVFDNKISNSFQLENKNEYYSLKYVYNDGTEKNGVECKIRNNEYNCSLLDKSESNSKNIYNILNK